MTARKIKDAWWVDFYLKVPGRPDARVRRRSPVQTKKGAETYERQLQEAALASSTLQSTLLEPTVEEFAKEFLTTYAAVNNRYSELESKEMILRVHLVPAFGALRLAEITPELIEKYKAAKRAKRPPKKDGEQEQEPLSAKTVNNHLTVLGKMLAVAVEWNRLAAVPKIKWLRLPKQQFDFFTFAEAEALVDGADAGQWRTMILVGLRTGLRLSELRALHWNDIDLDAGRLIVRRNVAREQLGPPKNGLTREVPLAPSVVDALRAHRHLRGPFVFVAQAQPGGRRRKSKLEWVTKNETKHPLWRACDAAELRRVGWHVLRHTFASHLAMHGVSMRVIQELLGHQSIAMTQRYSHLSPHVGRSAVGLLDLPAEKPLGRLMGIDPDGSSHEREKSHG